MKEVQRRSAIRYWIENCQYQQHKCLMNTNGRDQTKADHQGGAPTADN